MIFGALATISTRCTTISILFSLNIHFVLFYHQIGRFSAAFCISNTRNHSSSLAQVHRGVAVVFRKIYTYNIQFLLIFIIICDSFFSFRVQYVEIFHYNSSVGIPICVEVRLSTKIRKNMIYRTAQEIVNHTLF